MKTVNPFKSIQITPPFGGVLLRAILIIACTVLLGEGIIRLGVIWNLWQEPLLGTANAELDIKIQALDTITRTEKVDCIFLGSSQLDTAINPEIFSDEFEKQTGSSIRCYNFSLGTLTAGPAGKVAALLAYRYQPGLLVVGISARDFSRDFGELARPLMSDPWVKDRIGQPNLAGRLTENSLFFRYLNQLRVSFNPDYQAFRERLLTQLAPDGLLRYTGNDLTIDTSNFIPKYKLNAEDLSGLDEIMAVEKQGAQVLLLEIPVYPDFLPFYVEGETAQYYNAFRTPIQQRVDVFGVPFIYTQEEIGSYLPPSAWNDVKHLNIKGAKTFSRWFARRAAGLYNPENINRSISMTAYGNH